MHKLGAHQFPHGHRTERKDRPRFAHESYPDARHRGRTRNRGRGRRRSRSPLSFRKAPFGKAISDRREFEEREGFFDDRGLAPRDEDDRQGNWQARDLPFPESERLGRFTSGEDRGIDRHERDRKDRRRRPLPRESDYCQIRETREFFQSTTPSHQIFPEEREHFPRDEAGRLPPWSLRAREHHRQEVWENGNTGFFPMAERAEIDFNIAERSESPRRSLRDTSPRPPWWSDQHSDMEGKVTDMLRAWQNEENVSPPPERGAAFVPNVPQFALFPNDEMASPRQPMQNPLDGKLDPQILETISEEQKSDLAGNILYLVYQLFNGKITRCTMPASTATEPFTEKHVINMEQRGNGFIPLKIDKNPTCSITGKDAIAAGELYKEIQLHLKISFPSVKALCQLLRRYKNIFQVEGNVDIAGCNDDSSQGPDFEDGELSDGEEVEGNISQEAADEPWFSMIFRARFDLILCRKHSNKPDTCNIWECQDLHICRHYLLSGMCKFGKFCKFQHHLNSEHNRNALQSRLLHHFPLNEIFELARSVKYRNDSTMPRLCTFYNNGRGDGCKSAQCPYLHVCKRYIQGDCFPVVPCPLSHSLSDSQPKSILKRCGLDFNESQLDFMELIREVLQKHCIEQKISSDIHRAEKPKSKQLERLLKMTRPKMTFGGVLGGKEGVSPDDSKHKPNNWALKTKSDQTASVGLWQQQQRNSTGEEDSWSDVTYQTELEELYQQFLNAARPCITLNGQRVEVNFQAMSASVDGVETLAFRRRSTVSSVPDLQEESAIPETSSAKSPE